MAKDVKDFESSVVGQFPVSGGKDEGVTVTIPRSVFLLATTAKGLASEIQLKRKTYDAQQASYSFNFYRHEFLTIDNKTSIWQVAIVYQTEKGGLTKADPAITASLATLGVDTETVAMWAGYRKTNRRWAGDAGWHALR